MDYYALHSEKLTHKCVLPFSVLDHLLANGTELQACGILCAITALDDEILDGEGNTVVLGMDRFSEKGDINCIMLPNNYLPSNTFVRLSIIHEHQYADKMVLQAETCEFSKEEDPESMLVIYIQNNAPVINTGAVLEIAGHRLHVVSLWQGDTQISYTSTLNHDLPVEFIPSIEAEQRMKEEAAAAEAYQKYLAKTLEDARVAAPPTPVQPVTKFVGEGHVIGGTAAATREERLAAILKKFKPLVEREVKDKEK